MKQIILWVVMIVALILLVSCGGQETPTTFPTVAPTAAPVEEPTATEEPTQEPAAEPTTPAEPTPASLLDTMEHEADPRLVDFSWLWESRTGGVEDIEVADPENYTLIFNEDGTFNAKLDCNSGSGSYATASLGAIFMELGPVSLAECGPDSLSNEMLNMFGPAQSYSFEEGDDILTFNWVAGGPVDTFRKVGSESEDSGIIGVTWQWEAFQDTAEIDDTTVLDPGKYTLILNPDGTTSIQADCNQVSWTYKLEGSSLTFDTLGPSTLAFCGEESLDQQYLALLGETVSYVTADGKLNLNLKFDSGNMVFGQDQGIVGTSWQWEAFQDTAEINDITVPDIANYTFTLNPDGTASIQADCNQVSWTYELEGSSLTFNTLGPSTLAFCGEESLNQQYLTLLGETVTYVTDGGKLYLNLKLDTGNMVFNDEDDSTASAGSADEEVDDSFFPSTIQMDVEGLAKTYEWQVIDASPIPPGPGGKGFPRHIVVGFDGEDPMVTDYTQRWVMYIFPTEAYIDLYQANGDSVVADQVVRLEQLVTGADDRQGQPQGFMPLLPPPNSLMERWVQFSDLNFEQGKGVRYVSDSPLRQSIGVWTNSAMGYYYQGLTDDGRFYISLQWPVSTGLLPDTIDDASPELREEAGGSRESYDLYDQQLKSDLNALGPAEWSPDLSQLDALIASLSFQAE